ncbi:hypothetical protein QL285_039485 [Trifolium repens]|nr:hypothetical protein QL285_039485 [Trifolium repens]
MFNDSTALTEDDLYELRNCWATCFLDLFNPKNDYDDVEDKTNNKAPKFNGDGATFSWWKDRIYSHLIGLDDELWDLVEEGVTFKGLDEKGKLSIEERKKFTPTNKKLYKKHHKVKDLFIGCITHDEYLKITDKSTDKSIYDSLCSTYEGNKQVQEAKTTLLIQQYELFRMKDDENIQSMYSRFKILVAGLQVLKRSYTTSDHALSPAKHRITACLDLNLGPLIDLDAPDLSAWAWALSPDLLSAPPSLAFCTPF